MGTELNPIDDQRRRIGGAKSAEEKVAAIMEAADDGMELSDEQLEAVSGGNVIVPSTHEEIDQLWDVIQTVRDTRGRDVAVQMAFDMHLIPYKDAGNGDYLSTKKSISACRAWMHDALNGKADPYGM